MPPLPIESAVFSFEGLLPDLESPPIAARRALDHAGMRLSMEAWRSLPGEDRQRLALAGVPERVDVDLVIGLVRRASPPPQRVGAVFDPDAGQPPEALAHALEPARPIDARRWSRLRGLDRYALAHTYRRAVARSAFSMLGEAFDAILAASAAAPQTPAPAAVAARAAQQTTGSYQPAGYYSSVTTPPDATEAVPLGKRGLPTPSWIPPHRSAAAEAQRTGRELDPRAEGDYQVDERPFAGRAVRAGQRPGSIAPPPGATSSAPPPGASAPPPAVFSTHAGPGGEVHMVDVGEKPETRRRAIAAGSVLMRAETAARIGRRETPKGEVLATARLAGIMAAKRTPELIPLCHAVRLSSVQVDIEVDVPGARVNVLATAEAVDRTGVEMEAMVAASVACLTLYDMLKGVDRDMIVSEVKLLEKSGGRTGTYRRGSDRP